MNDHRETFERDLRAQLAITPSSDLQSRIRERTFSTPVKRTPWFALTSGLAAAVAAVILLVIYIQAERSQNSPPFEKVAVRAPAPVSTDPATEPLTEPPTQPASAPSRDAVRSTKSYAPSGMEQPALVEIHEVATASTGLTPGRIELLPLSGLELTNSLAPLPPAPPLSIARFEPINIEPPALVVRNLGVNE